MTPDRFTAYWVSHDGTTPRGELATRRLDELPAGEVLIAVAYSSLNYKDALSATGHVGVTRRFPHIPGIDAAGTVVTSEHAEFKPGDEVIVTGFDLGMNTWGGFAEYIRVPAAWVVPLPAGLSLREAMILGTAGLTAALCVDALQRNDVDARVTPILVTGSTGGVGCLAVALLAHLGFEVTAATGKPATAFLHELGARNVIAREQLRDDRGRPLLPARFAAAVDTVGGDTLAAVVKSLRYGGSVAACGLVGGADLAMTVYPFILRGVNLLGIDSAQCAPAKRREMWRRLAGAWKPPTLETVASEIGLAELPQKIRDILAGAVRGRVLVRVHT